MADARGIAGKAHNRQAKEHIPYGEVQLQQSESHIVRQANSKLHANIELRLASLCLLSSGAAKEVVSGIFGAG